MRLAIIEIGIVLKEIQIFKFFLEKVLSYQTKQILTIALVKNTAYHAIFCRRLAKYFKLTQKIK